MKRLLTEASLIMKPEGQADGLLPSVKPLDGSGDFTFSRGSNLAATRVNQAGLIEKGRENLLLQSNKFDTTWSSINTTETSGQADKDGGTDAWLILKSASGARVQQAISVTGVQTFSVYAKANASNWIALWTNVGTSYFDLSSGTKGSTGASTTIGSAMESVGNGWYRCSLIFNTSISNVRIYPADGDLDTSGTSGSVYIQDAQLESGLVATPYIETTTTTGKAGVLEDTPRLDYSGGATEPSLLLEPQRSNLNRHSEYFAFWVNNGASITSNSITSPEGKQNASTITGVSGNNRIYLLENISSGTKYTLSFYAKKGTSSTIFLDFINVSSGTTFNFDTKTWGTNAAWDLFDYEELDNGWFRLYGVINSNTTNAGIGISVASGQTAYIYGTQLEAGNYPTSYIPTYGSAVTRSYENMNNQAIVGDLSNNYTFFFDAVRLLDGDGTQRWFYTTGLNGTNLQVYLISGGIDGRIRLFFRAAGESSDSSITWELGPQEGSRYKIAIVRSEGSLKFFADGSLIGENTNNVPDELTYYNVFAGNGAQRLNQYLIFPTALTDSECIALTSL